MNEEADGTVPDVDPRLSGIGGWLVLPAIGLVLGPILAVVSLAVGGALFSQVAATGHGGLFAVEMATEFGLLIFMIFAASRFFRKKRDAPMVIIVLIVVGLAANGLMLLAELAVGAEDFAEQTTKMLVRSIINAAIWIPYFKVSKRVKATFVN